MSFDRLGEGPEYGVDERDERMQFLSGSGIRTEILRRLREEQLIERDLRDALDAPRSTVHQNAEKLAERGWIERTPEGYRTTWMGSIVLDEYESCCENIETAQRLAPLLKHVDSSEIDLSAVSDSAVTTSEPNRPNAAMARLSQLIEQSDRLRGLTPFLVPSVVELVHEMVVEDGFAVEMVSSAAAASALLAEYPDETSATLGLERVEVLRYDGQLPFLLCFVAGKTVLGAFDDHGHPRTVVETTSDDAREWAEGVYRKYYNASDPLSPSDSECR